MNGTFKIVVPDYTYMRNLYCRLGKNILGFYYFLKRVVLVHRKIKQCFTVRLTENVSLFIYTGCSSRCCLQVAAPSASSLALKREEEIDRWRDSKMVNNGVEGAFNQARRAVQAADHVTCFWTLRCPQSSHGVP